MTTLPGPMIDLLTDGVDLGHGDPAGSRSTRDRAHATGRQVVIKAVRQIMLSAHRHGMAYTDIYVMLTDEKKRRLAAQLATGRGGRPISPVKREELLDKLWTQTGEFAAKQPALTRDDMAAAVEHVRTRSTTPTTSTPRSGGSWKPCSTSPTPTASPAWPRRSGRSPRPPA